jgi:hypothetical protein
VQVAFAAAQARPGAAAGGPDQTAAVETLAEPERPDAPAVVTPPQDSPRATRSMPAAVLPWLGAVTLAVLYLLAKTFL